MPPTRDFGCNPDTCPDWEWNWILRFTGQHSILWAAPASAVWLFKNHHPMICLLIPERGRESERETPMWERNIHQLPPTHTDRGHIHNPRVCPDRELNPQPLGEWDHTPPKLPGHGLLDFWNDRTFSFAQILPAKFKLHTRYYGDICGNAKAQVLTSIEDYSWEWMPDTGSSRQ